MGKPLKLTCLTLMATVLLVTADPDERLAEVLSCLDKKTEPGKECSINLTYKEPLNGLSCDQQLPLDQKDALKDRPIIAVPNPKGKNFPIPILILMYDVDLPSNNKKDGFVHWVAKARLYEGGTVNEIEDNEGQSYFPPQPPSGEKHRYQMYVFNFDGDKKIVKNSNSDRQDQFCNFKKANHLGDPLASTQFQYQDSEKK